MHGEDGDLMSDDGGDLPDIEGEDVVEDLVKQEDESKEKQEAELQRIQDSILASSKEWLREVDVNEDPVKTSSGLQYEVIRDGEVDEDVMPTLEDKVTVHYHGTLMNDTIFDSSIQRGDPVTFPVNGVIPGWVEALQLMTVGDKWKITIPPHLAYGEKGVPQAGIPPNENLIFIVELLKIN